jgi:hypothetical protein
MATNLRMMQIYNYETTNNDSTTNLLMSTKLLMVGIIRRLKCCKVLSNVYYPFYF